MLTYADRRGASSAERVRSERLECSRCILTYYDVCSRMLTYADADADALLARLGDSGASGLSDPPDVRTYTILIHNLPHGSEAPASARAL